MSGVDVPPVPLAIVLACCAPHAAEAVRRRMADGERAVDPARVVVWSGGRYWAQVRFLNTARMGLIFPLDAWTADPGSDAERRVDAMAALRASGLPEMAPNTLEGECPTAV